MNLGKKGLVVCPVKLFELSQCKKLSKINVKLTSKHSKKNEINDNKVLLLIGPVVPIHYTVHERWEC